MAYESLDGFWKTRTHSKACGGCHVSTFPGRGVTSKLCNSQWIDPILHNDSHNRHLSHITVGMGVLGVLLGYVLSIDFGSTKKTIPCKTSRSSQNKAFFSSIFVFVYFRFIWMIHMWFLWWKCRGICQCLMIHGSWWWVIWVRGDVIYNGIIWVSWVWGIAFVWLVSQENSLGLSFFLFGGSFFL